MMRIQFQLSPKGMFVRAFAMVFDRYLMQNSGQNIRN